MGDSGTDDEKIKVWELQVFGNKVIFNSLDDLCDSLSYDIEDIEEPEDITISPIWMTKHKYNNLPEFDGH